MPENYAEQAKTTIPNYLSNHPNMPLWLNRQVMLAFTHMLLMAEVLGYDTAPMEGFEEEKEWRIVYARERDTANHLSIFFSHLIGVKGIEPKLKFKIQYIEGVTAQDLSLSKIADRIILGPSVSSPISSMTFKRLLVQHNEAELAEKVFASTIPFRSPT